MIFEESLYYALLCSIITCSTWIGELLCSKLHVYAGIMCQGLPVMIPPQGDVWEVYHDIASYLLQTTSDNVVGKKKGRRSPQKVMAPSSAKGGVHRTSSQPLLLPSSQPQSKVPLTRGTRALSAGAVTRRLRTRVSQRGVPLMSAGLKEPGKYGFCICIPTCTLSPDHSQY